MSVLFSDQNLMFFYRVFSFHQNTADINKRATGPLNIVSTGRRVDQAARRWAASSSASSLFSLISASVRTKRVHSSFRGTAVCWGQTEAWLNTGVSQVILYMHIYGKNDDITCSKPQEIVWVKSTRWTTHSSAAQLITTVQITTGKVLNHVRNNMPKWLWLNNREQSREM